MSLSDRERRLLAEMEEALATDDPRLQSALSGSTRSAKGAKPVAAAAGILLGIGILFAGLVAQVTPIGVAGFIVALAGVLALIRGIGAKEKVSTAGSSHTRSRKGWSSRLEERWDRRNFER
jgi:Flp pilus assembly protein TadB